MNYERLRDLRKEKKLNQKDVAHDLGLSVSAIGMYEQGRREPDNKTMLRLAEYFEVSVGYLMGSDTEHTSLNKEAIAEEIMKNLTQQNALMFRAGELTDEDYSQLSEAVKIAVDIAVEREKQKQD